MVAYLEFGDEEIKGSERRGAKLAWAVGPERGRKEAEFRPGSESPSPGLPLPRVRESGSVVSDLCNCMDYTVHGILQARILQWVAFPFFRGSS